MFKRLRERIAEEGIKFPVGQIANNSGKLPSESENKSAEANSTEDLITLSDSSSVVVPHTSPQQFSIGEDEDGSFSEQSTPQKKQNVPSGSTDTHNSKEHHSGNIADLGFGQEYRPSKKLSYVPQSDIESEREDPPTLNLDGISKDQLMTAIQTLKARSYKYKNKYAEVVKNYKELREEKVKIETTLIENQDKGLRRIAELREQCQLEQKAKAHLEENLRLLLDEKDSRICVLETQINLLKNDKSGSTKTLPEDCDNQFSDGGNGDTRSEDSTTSMSSDIAALQEKVERLQHQHNQDKKTITAQKDQVNLLRKQNENISQELEEKVKRLNYLEDEQLKLKSQHESVLHKMQDRLLELEKQQEESNMSMAETKRNMHEELELKEKQLVKAEEETKLYQVSAKHEKELVADLRKQHEEQVKDLLYKLELTEKTLEEEKQSLLHELGQGKTAAINLMQQECARKISAIEEEWKSKCEALQSASQVQVIMEELSNSLKITEEKLNKTQQRVEELDSVVSVLEKENASLKNSVEKLESDLCLSSANYEKLKANYSDYEALKEKENLFKKQEALNNELSDKIAKYVSIEQDLQIICGSLTQELNEQKIFISSLENEKIDLINKIHNYEVAQKELETHCDNLKNEISALKENLSNQSNKIENITHDNITKLDEIDNLQKHFKNVELNEKLISEKLSMSIAESKEFEAENADLLLNNRLLNDEIENLKNSLRIKEKELNSVNDVFSKSYNEINLLKETVEIKESMLKQAVVSFKQVESLAESIEQQQANIKMAVEKFENICKSVFKTSNYLSKNFELIKKAYFEPKVDLSKSDCDILVSENKINNDCSKLQELCNKSTESILAHSDYKNEDETDAQTLLKDISVLKRENANLKEELCACKTFSELQNIEFAKNITVLQQSHSDLQEERNNLSLVLQNIENTQMDKSKCEFQNDILCETEGKLKNDDIDYQRNWEMRIAELNSKVKSEIEALSSQTETANKELRSLREQFKSNQDSYSEKLMQLNSKLLYRTETLINLKEDLDVSVQNANYLKELLESTREELCKKNELLNSVENGKRELEAKCKSLKETYFKKECELKEAHNSQLIDLKNQTELTIDKLNEQIKLLNKLLNEKDEELSKLASVEQNYQNAISNFQNQVEEVINCHTKINKLNDTSNSFEDVCVSKLDKYCSKITNIGSKVNQFISKLKEKDEKIAEQNSSLQKFEEQLKGYAELHKDFNVLKNEFDSTAQLLEAANKELDCEKMKSLSCANETSKLKDDYEMALQKIKMFSSNISDTEKLQSLLDIATKKLESSEVEHSETCSELINQNRELQEFREKYQCAIKDSDNLNKLLNEEKNKLQIQITATSELSNKYNSIVCEVNAMSAKLNEHIEKSSRLLDEKDAQLKTADSKLSTVSSQCESKFQEISNLKSQMESYEIENSKLKNDYERASQENKQLSVIISNKDELQSLLDISTEKLRMLEGEHSEACSKLSIRDSELQEFQEKYQSALKDTERLNKQLDEEKYQLQMQLATTDELSNKYNSIVYKVDCMSSKFNEHKEKINRLLGEKDAQLKNAESKFSVISSRCGLKDQEILGLKMMLDSSFKDLADTKADFEKKMKISNNVILEWKTKYESAVLKVEEMSLSNEASFEDLQLLLNEREIQLNEEKIKCLTNKVELEEKFNLQSDEMLVIQDKLNQNVEELQKCQKLLDEQVQNVTALENEKLEWELKYNTTFEELAKVSNASLKDKEDIKQLMLDLDAKTIQISAMVPPEKLKELEENELELRKYVDQVKNLQLEIEALSSSLSETESVIKRKESEKENLESHHEESLKCMKDKLQNAEKNYKTQMEQMKLKLNQLEKENSILVSEKENLLVVQKQFKELKTGEDKIQLELKLKEDELTLLREKLETTNKEEVEKIHTFQENMKDKDNMILKLKANIESISKEHSENVEELHKKIKRLEIEREQLMLQAQERVSATEAKCREDIKALQEKYEKLLLENKEIEKLRNQIGLLNAQLDESLLVAESNQASATQEISLLKDKLFSADTKLAEVQKSKLASESELSTKLEKLQQENKLLLSNSDHLEKLKAEKGELNEKLKSAVQQVNKIKVLETERDTLKKENEKLSKEIQHIRTVQSESTSSREKLKLFEENESAMKIKIENLTAENEQLKSEILGLKNSFESEKDSLSLENDKLKNQIQQLENCVSDSQNTSVKDYVDSLKKEYELAIKAKDDEMLCKLKQLVKDFSIQMDVKDKDSEQMIAELMEKNQYIEEKFQREHATAVSALRKDMLSKDCALEDMREHFEETIQEKDAKIKKLEQTIKSLISKDDASAEHLNAGSEHSDWDDSWVVPDEVVENSSPVLTNKPCDEHVQQIESLQEELSKSNSEIKELKILLRLSPPDSMVNNNNRRDSVQSLPEPTEFEYLKNIIYEYMMGKEPVTLAKVIAAVLRFNDVQTQQVIRREESRHTAK